MATDGWIGIETVRLDRGYDYPEIRRLLVTAGLADHVI